MLQSCFYKNIAAWSRGRVLQEALGTPGAPGGGREHLAAADDAGVAPPTGLSCSKAKPACTRGGGPWCSPSAWCTPAVPGGSCRVSKPF